MQDFFDKYPEIYSSCKDVNTYINTSLSGISIDENEISFDHLIPFIFQEIPENKRMDIAIALRIGREIIDFYNKGKIEVTPFINILNSYYSETFMSFEEYQLLNVEFRQYQNNDIIESYLSSTKRVNYRNKIISYFSFKNKFDLTESFFEQLDILSAFFLYDDDICDFEEDVIENKRTILTDYTINREGDLLISNKLFSVELNSIIDKNNSNKILCQFIATFKKLYT
ncbi:MAG: hypothetical protein VB102_05545 [Paludibacter sp.]|nr:hypothetical protein [Paludibacter sp.]